MLAHGRSATAENGASANLTMTSLLPTDRTTRRGSTSLARRWYVRGGLQTRAFILKKTSWYGAVRYPRLEVFDARTRASKSRSPALASRNRNARTGASAAAGTERYRERIFGIPDGGRRRRQALHHVPQRGHRRRRGPLHRNGRHARCARPGRQAESERLLRRLRSRWPDRPACPADHVLL